MSRIRYYFFCITSDVYLNTPKTAQKTPIHKKLSHHIVSIINQFLYLVNSGKFLKVLYLTALNVLSDIYYARAKSIRLLKKRNLKLQNKLILALEEKKYAFCVFLLYCAWFNSIFHCFFFVINWMDWNWKVEISLGLFFQKWVLVRIIWCS